MKPATNSLAKKKHAIPHVYIILLIIILLATVLTYIVPAGQFDRETVDNVKMVIPGTYHRIDQTPVNLFDMFVAIPQGFVSMANIVILIYMCVAGMGILTSTGALERVFGSFISKVGAKGRVVMLIIFYAFFFVRGGLTGSVNSPIAFIPLVVTLCLAVGYDVMTALGVVAVGALVGFAVGPTNPNTVVVAQQICELPVYSGMTFRTITWLVLGLAGLIYVVIYAEKVRKNPSASLSSYKPDTQELQNENMQKAATTRDKWVVFTLFVAVVAIVVLTVKFSLSMVQMAGLYIIIGIIGGLVAGYKPNEIAAMFTKYGKEMFTAALVLGMAKAVPLVLTQGNIIDTMVYGMSSILGGLPAGLSAVIMFLIQTIVNFFINSGSGQAAAMMPIMAPLSDLIGVSRQTAILAFQMGDGLSNMI
ncbi:YfcC family protein [Hominenteromicrobium sp.]|uniref:YfcC family protein n=1 Tax=Hominenteromicrobium sp. TaxID=3073581 RepID=UPI003AF5DB79